MFPIKNTLKLAWKLALILSFFLLFKEEIALNYKLINMITFNRIKKEYYIFPHFTNFPPKMSYALCALPVKNW